MVEYSAKHSCWSNSRDCAGSEADDDRALFMRRDFTSRAIYLQAIFLLTQMRAREMRRDSSKQSTKHGRCSRDTASRVQCKHGLLLGRLGRDKAHARSGNGRVRTTRGRAAVAGTGPERTCAFRRGARLTPVLRARTTNAAWDAGA